MNVYMAYACRCFILNIPIKFYQQQWTRERGRGRGREGEREREGETWRRRLHWLKLIPEPLPMPFFFFSKKSLIRSRDAICQSWTEKCVYIGSRECNSHTRSSVFFFVFLFSYAFLAALYPQQQSIIFYFDDV